MRGEPLSPSTTYKVNVCSDVWTPYEGTCNVGGAIQVKTLASPPKAPLRAKSVKR
jgi:hypothetical protein